jgi:hypothetical protein
MRKILLSVILICGCGKEGKVPQSAAVETKQEKPAAAVIEKKSEGVQMLGFDSAAFRKDEYSGDVIGGAHWNDRAGENFLVVSQKFSRTEDNTLQQIYGYLYRMVDGRRTLLWKIEDRAENWCDPGTGLASEVVVKDLDGDGIAENAFVYNVAGACDVSPVPYKLMLHSGATKYAIRGESTVTFTDTALGGTKEFDPAFKTAPAGFREFASELWDKAVR